MLNRVIASVSVVALSIAPVAFAQSPQDWVVAGHGNGQTVEYVPGSVSTAPGFGVNSGVNQIWVRCRAGRKVLATYLAQVNCRDLSIRFTTDSGFQPSPNSSIDQIIRTACGR